MTATQFQAELHAIQNRLTAVHSWHVSLDELAGYARESLDVCERIDTALRLVVNPVYRDRPAVETDYLRRLCEEIVTQPHCTQVDSLRCQLIGVRSDLLNNLGSEVSW